MKAVSLQSMDYQSYCKLSNILSFIYADNTRFR